FGIETTRLVFERPCTISAREPTVGTGCRETMISGDVTWLLLSAGCLASALLADIRHAGDRLSVAEGVDGRHRVVVHVPAAGVCHFGNRVVYNVPVLDLQPHVVPDRAVATGNGAAHHVAIVVELADGIGAGQAMDHHGNRLPPPE